MYIMLEFYKNQGPPYYSNHAVLGYAWSCMQSTSTHENKYFIKICDGINSSGRYLDMSQQTNQTYLGNDDYIEMFFG